MPVLDGVETTQQLSEQHPDVAIVILTTFVEEADLIEKARPQVLLGGVRRHDDDVTLTGHGACPLEGGPGAFGHRRPLGAGTHPVFRWSVGEQAGPREPSAGERPHRSPQRGPEPGPEGAVPIMSRGSDE